MHCSPFDLSYTQRKTQLSSFKEAEQLKDYGQGKRCFIIATGPSLKKFPLELLKNDFTFGVNQSYLALNSGLPHLDALLIADPASYKNYHKDIEKAPVSCRLLRSDVYPLVKEKGYNPDRVLPYNYPLTPYMDEGYFAYDFSKGIYRGCSVVLDVVQVAYFMGFIEVYIIGCDLDYTGTDTHFYKNNEHEDATRSVMPIDRVRRSMSFAKSVYNKNNRILINATIGGTLEEIDRIDYKKLF